MLRDSLAGACAGLLAVLTTASLSADDKDKDAPVVQNANDCAKAQASARYVGYGFTHVITLKNGCARAVECSVWTDIDPEPRTTVRARPGESAEVVTRRGSPSREVSAFKLCSFR